MPARAAGVLPQPPRLIRRGYAYRGLGTRRADVLARAASDAETCVDARESVGNRDRALRTLPRARDALDPFRRPDADVLLDMGESDAARALLGRLARDERTDRTRLRALERARRAAEVVLEEHLRLPEALKRDGLAEDSARARLYTASARDALGVEAPAVQRARGHYAGGALRDQRKRHLGEASVRRLLDRLRRRQHRNTFERLAPRHAASVVRSLRGRFRLREARPAVGASLADLVAAHALRRKRREERSRRANPVAPDPPLPDRREDHHDGEENDSWDEERHRLAEDRVRGEEPRDGAESAE